MRLGGWKLPLERLSATAFSTYVSCPEQFRHKYLLNEPEPMRDDRFIGSVAHEALGFLFQEGFPEPEMALDAAWQGLLNKEGEPEWVKMDATEAYRRLSQMLKMYWPVASETKPIAVEQRFEEKILGVKVQGYIDLELTDRIREVKTTSQKQTKPKPRHGLQGRLYSLVSSKPVEWHYLTRQVTPQLYTPEECPALLQHFSSDTTVELLKRVIASMADDYARYGKDSPWPMSGIFGDWTCGYCSFLRACPAHVAAG